MMIKERVPICQDLVKLLEATQTVEPQGTIAKLNHSANQVLAICNRIDSEVSKK